MNNNASIHSHSTQTQVTNPALLTMNTTSYCKVTLEKQNKLNPNYFTNYKDIY